MRQLFIGGIVALLCCGASHAESWSKVRCEEPEVIEFIKAQLAKGKFDDGTPIGNYLGDNSKMTATTVSAQADRFICKISVSFTYGGNTEKIRGKFIVRQFGSGKASTQLVPY